MLRDGQTIALRAEEVVPGDVVTVEPGDQLVADGEVAASRGMTLDESMLTGEADGVRKEPGDRALSGSFCIAGSGRYVVDAVREESYAGKLAGEARAFRHPPSPLQAEVNQVIVACTWVMLPLAALLLITFKLRSADLIEAAQTATAGLVTLIPEGLVLLMTVTFAFAAVRLAHRKTLVQQMSATESLASVDTICVDKTGTLTDGELRLLGVEVAEGVEEAAAHAALAGFAASAGDRNRTLEAIAERFPGKAGPGERRGALLLGVEVERPADRRPQLRDGGARRARARRGAEPAAAASRRVLERETADGRRVVAFGESAEPLPASPPEGPPPRAHRRWRWSCSKRRCARTPTETIAYMREEEVDLKLISGDARSTVTAVAGAVGVPADAGTIEGPDLPTDPEGLAEAANANTIFCRIAPEQKKELVAALRESGRYTAMIGDGVNDVPALKQARLAVAMGSGTQVTKGVADVVLLEDEFARLPEAVAEGRRIARNIHRLGRLYMTKTVYAATLILLVAVPGFVFPFLPRHLTLAAFLTIGIPSFVLALLPSDGPLYRGRLLRALAAFAVPAGIATALGSILSFFLVDTIFGGSLDAGRTAATTTLIVLGLAFVLLLERGPGREHIAVQGSMLVMILSLCALFALILGAAPVREFFEMQLLGPTQWFLTLFSAAAGLTIASVLWRLPQIERLERPLEPGETAEGLTPLDLEDEQVA